MCLGGGILCARAMEEITPGKKSPSIQPLEDEAWVAVSALVEKSKAAPIMDSLAAAGGSYFGGVIYEATSNYNMALEACAGICFIAAVAVLGVCPEPLLRRPHRRRHHRLRSPKLRLPHRLPHRLRHRRRHARRAGGRPGQRRTAAQRRILPHQPNTRDPAAAAAAVGNLLARKSSSRRYFVGAWVITLWSCGL